MSARVLRFHFDFISPYSYLAWCRVGAFAHGHDLRVTGIPGMPYYRIAGDGGFGFHARWIAECVARGAYLLSYHNNFVSAAHTKDQLERTAVAFGEALEAAFA